MSERNPKETRTEGGSVTKSLPSLTFTLLPPHASEPRSEFIYFAYSAGRIKIGYSRGTETRYKRLKASGPFPPVMVLIKHGTIGDEQTLHALFHADRLHGEWFALSVRLRAYLRPRLCDIGRASLDRAEAEFRDYCETFLISYSPPPKRSRRPNCSHGMPFGSICPPCERERDLKVLERINAGTYSQ